MASISPSCCRLDESQVLGVYSTICLYSETLAQDMALQVLG